MKIVKAEIYEREEFVRARFRNNPELTANSVNVELFAASGTMMRTNRIYQIRKEVREGASPRAATPRMSSPKATTGMKINDADKIRSLEDELQNLRHAVADLMLENRALKGKRL